MSDMEPIAGGEREEKTEKKGFVPQDPSYEHFLIRIAPERRKMLDVAIKFLINPRVASSQLVDKVAFLTKKGLTEEEIYWATQEAAKRATTSLVSSSSFTTPPGPPPLPSRLLSWQQILVGGVMIGGVVGLVVYWIKTFINQWFSAQRVQRERLDDVESSIQQLQTNLEASVRELKESTQAIKTLLERQQQQLTTLTSQTPVITEHSLHSINSELTTLKGLLLNRHQFPTPQRGNSNSGIPSWQRSVSSPQDISIPQPESSKEEGDKIDTIIPNHD